MTHPEDRSPPAAASERPAMLVGGIVRAPMIVPVVAMQIASVALIAHGAVETQAFVSHLFGPAGTRSRDLAIFHSIELVDLFRSQRSCRSPRSVSTSSTSGPPLPCPAGPASSWISGPDIACLGIGSGR